MESQQKSPVPNVDESAVMSVPIGKPGKRKKYQPKYPLYEESELRVILRFLAAYLTEFEGALASERELAKGNEKIKMFAGRVRYRETQCMTIRELVKRAYWPQKHLSLVTDSEIDERIKTCL